MKTTGLSAVVSSVVSIIWALCILGIYSCQINCQPECKQCECNHTKCDCNEHCKLFKLHHYVIRSYVGIGVDKQHWASGVLVVHNKHVYIITAAHVIEEAKNGQSWNEVYWKSSTENLDQTIIGTAKVVYSSLSFPNGSDLAILIPTSNIDYCTPIELTSVQVYPGEECWYIGTSNGLHGSLERSIVNQVVIKNNRPWIVINGNGWYGASGGPVFVYRSGRFVLSGLTIALDNPYSIRSSILCVPVEFVLDLLCSLEDNQ